MHKEGLRIGIVLIWLALIILGVTTHVHADFTVDFTGSELTITVVDGGNITVGSDASDFVTVNGNTLDENIDAADVSLLYVYGDDGPNEISCADVLLGTFTSLTHCTIEGRGGNDTLTGSPGNDTLKGGPGDDDVFGGQKADTIQWALGDGSDSVDGDGGVNDSFLIDGNPASTNFRIGENGGSLTFEVSGESSLTTISNVESFFLYASTGDDGVVVEDLSGLSNTPTITLNSNGGNDFFDARLANYGINFSAVATVGSAIYIGSTMEDTLDFRWYDTVDNSTSVLYRRDGRNFRSYWNAGYEGRVGFRHIENVIFSAGNAARTICVHDMTDTDIETIDINGTAFDDKIFVTASGFITYDVDGGDGSADVLRVDTLGESYRTGPGLIEVDGYNTINHENVEVIEFSSESFVTGDRITLK